MAKPSYDKEELKKILRELKCKSDVVSSASGSDHFEKVRPCNYA